MPVGSIHSHPDCSLLGGGALSRPDQHLRQRAAGGLTLRGQRRISLCRSSCSSSPHDGGLRGALGDGAHAWSPPALPAVPAACWVAGPIGAGAQGAQAGCGMPTGPAATCRPPLEPPCADRVRSGSVWATLAHGVWMRGTALHPAAAYCLRAITPQLSAHHTRLCRCRRLFCRAALPAPRPCPRWWRTLCSSCTATSGSATSTRCSSCTGEGFLVMQG